ncbi:MAG: hypothetical protein DRQ46_00185 [Gammaproteobacteria bacterium]|nr:MAG: hypothetical protein DRQ46_00185 [Gammaproteobacteria bacterium]
MRDATPKNKGIMKVASKIDLPSYIDLIQHPQAFFELDLYEGEQLLLSGEEAKIMIWGGRIPYFNQVVLKLPLDTDAIKITQNADNDEEVKLKASSNKDKFGAYHCELYDSDYRRESMLFIANPHIRNYEGKRLGSIKIYVGEKIPLTYYAGLTPNQVFWYDVNGLVEVSTQGPLINIIGRTIGSTNLNVTGLFGASESIPVEVQAAPEE